MFIFIEIPNTTNNLPFYVFDIYFLRLYKLYTLISSHS